MSLRSTAPSSTTFPSYLSRPSKSPLLPPILASLFRRRNCAPSLSLRQQRIIPAAAAYPAQQQQVENTNSQDAEWGKVSAVLFDMDGVLCNSEELSRMAAVDVFAEMGVSVATDDFIPFMGTGEASFLGGVAKVKGVEGFDPEAAKKRFFEIYIDKYAKPNSGIGFPGALELIMECKRSGLKVAVASSADRIKVDANLAAAGLPISLSCTNSLPHQLWTSIHLEEITSSSYTPDSSPPQPNPSPPLLSTSTTPMATSTSASTLHRWFRRW